MVSAVVLVLLVILGWWLGTRGKEEPAVLLVVGAAPSTTNCDPLYIFRLQEHDGRLIPLSFLPEGHRSTFMIALMCHLHRTAFTNLPTRLLMRVLAKVVRVTSLLSPPEEIVARQVRPPS